MMTDDVGVRLLTGLQGRMSGGQQQLLAQLRMLAQQLWSRQSGKLGPQQLVVHLPVQRARYTLRVLSHRLTHGAVRTAGVGGASEVDRPECGDRQTPAQVHTRTHSQANPHISVQCAYSVAGTYHVSSTCVSLGQYFVHRLVDA